MDAAARKFISAHRDLEIDDIIAAIAEIPSQPLTYLTIYEEDRIRQIMRIKINNLWDDTFYSPD